MERLSVGGRIVYLTSVQAIVFTALRQRGRMTTEELAELMYGDERPENDWNGVSGTIGRLRRRLRGTGVVIEAVGTRGASGYRLTEGEYRRTPSGKIAAAYGVAA